MAFSDFLHDLLARQPEAQPTLGFMPQQPPSPPPPPGTIDENIGGSSRPLIPPWLSEPSSSLKIQGIPLVPLFAGLGLGALNYSTASKRMRNQAAGEGFGFGYGLLNIPIERERAEQQRIQGWMLDKGYAVPYDPYGGDAGTTVVPPVPTTAGLGVPGIAPTGPISGPFTPVAGAPASAAIAGPRGRVLFKYGGRPMYSNQVTPEDLGIKLPAGSPLAHRQLPGTPEVILAAAGDQEARDYYVAQGGDPNAPLAVMKEAYEQSRDVKRQQEAKAQNAPTGTDIATRTKIDSSGKVTTEYDQLSLEARDALKRQREEDERKAAEYKELVKQRELGRAYGISQGADPNMSNAQADDWLKEKLVADRIAAGEQKIVPGPGTQISQTVDPTTGRVGTIAVTAPPVDVDQKQQEFEQKQEEHGWKKKEFEYKESEKGLVRQAAKNRNLDPTAPIALLLEQIKDYETTKRAEAARAKITSDPNAAYVEEVDAAGNKIFRKTTPSTLEIQRENAKQDILQKELQLRQQQINNEVANMDLNRLEGERRSAQVQYQGFVTAIDRIQASNLPPGPELKRLENERDLALYRMDALDKRSRGEPIGPEAETKRPDPDVKKIMAYTDELGPKMLQSREDFRKIRALPGPPDPLQNKGHQIVIDQMQKILDYYVPRFEALAAPTWGGFGSKDLTSEQKDALRATTPGGDFDWAYYQWKHGYAPGYAPYTPPIPAAPTTTSTIPPAPVVTSPQFPVRRSFTSITPTPTTRPQFPQHRASTAVSPFPQHRASTNITR